MSTERPNQCLGYLIDPTFQGVNRLFVLSFGNENDRKANTGYYLPKVVIENYNIKIDGRNMKTLKNGDIGEGDHYTTDCLLNCSYFKEKL